MDFCQIPISDVQLGTQRRQVGDISWLVESIREHGLLHPILVTEDQVLVAGWHRLEAMKQLKYEQIPARILGPDKLRSSMAAIDENLVRKELTALERAEHLSERKHIYEALYPDTRRGGNRGNQYVGGRKRQTAISAFCQQATVWTGKSQRSVRQYVQVANRLTPEAKAKLEGSEFADSITVLTSLTRVPSLLQAKTVQALTEKKASSVRKAFEVVRRESYVEHNNFPVSAHNAELLLGDFRIVGDKIPDGTVDLVLTDPPYDMAGLEVFEPLGAFSQRILKPGGSLFCMIGAYHLPQIIASLNKHLKWQWAYSFVLGGQGSIVHSRRVSCAHKLILWFVKGKYTGAPYTDVIMGIGRDKRFHPWGQSENGFDQLVARYSSPGSLIVDPFVGGGTTGAVAVKLGRRFIGIDREPSAIEITRQRLASTDFPN